MITKCISLGFFIGWYPIKEEYATIEHIDCHNKQIFIDKDTMNKVTITDYVLNTNTYIIEEIQDGKGNTD